MEIFEKVWLEQCDPILKEADDIYGYAMVKLVPYCLAKVSKDQDLVSQAQEFKTCNSFVDNQFHKFQLKNDWEIRYLEKCVGYMKKNNVRSDTEIVKMCFADTTSHVKSHFQAFQQKLLPVTSMEL